MREVVDTAIIGAGLFGSIIARALTKEGHKVVVFDDERAEAGSKPAACLMKPGWFSALGKAVYDPALTILDKLYGLEEIPFKTPAGFVNVLWVPPAKILITVYIPARVTKIVKGDSAWHLHTTDHVLSVKRVIVAGGVWSEELVPEIHQRGWAGMAFLWPKRDIAQPFIRVWAPYKQVVGFNRGDGLWVGDGSAILRQNWTEARAKASYERCVKGIPDPPQKLFGIRPYHPMRPCLLEEVHPNLWVASGGAKNGTLAAGWCAAELIKALQ